MPVLNRQEYKTMSVFNLLKWTENFLFCIISKAIYTFNPMFLVEELYKIKKWLKSKSWSKNLAILEPQLSFDMSPSSDDAGSHEIVLVPYCAL